MIGLLICSLLTVIALVLESVFNVSKSVVLIGLLPSYIIVLAIVMYKIITRNRREAEARREAYREKFERRSGLY